VRLVGFEEFYENVMYNKTGRFGEMLKQVEKEI